MDHKNTLKPELPAKFHTVFVQDASVNVRSALARKSALTQHVMETLLQDKTINVLAALTSNPETPLDILESAEARMRNFNKQLSTRSGSESWHAPHYINQVGEGISASPHISQKLIATYLADDTIVNNFNIAENLYENPQVTQTAINLQYKKLAQQVEKGKQIHVEFVKKLRSTKTSKEDKVAIRKQITVLNKKRKIIKDHLLLLVSTGRCGRDVTKKMIDENLSSAHRNYGATLKAGGILAKAQRLTLEDFAHYTQGGIVNKNLLILAGIVANPNTPESVVDEIRKNLDDLSNTFNLYPVNILKEELNRRAAN